MYVPLTKIPLKDFEDRYMPEPNSGCWLWLLRGDKDGYGRLGFGVVDGKQVFYKAHRLSYFMFVGDPGSLDVLHKCDTPACVNPDHLFLGTKSDNVADKVAKNRQDKGDKHGRAKLTKDDVLEIRRRAASGEKHTDLANRFGVHYGHISALVRKRFWSHL